MICQENHIFLFAKNELSTSHVPFIATSTQNPYLAENTSDFSLSYMFRYISLQMKGYLSQTFYTMMHNPVVYDIIVNYVAGNKVNFKMREVHSL